MSGQRVMSMLRYSIDILASGYLLKGTMPSLITSLASCTDIIRFFLKKRHGISGQSVLSVLPVILARQEHHTAFSHHCLSFLYIYYSFIDRSGIKWASWVFFLLFFYYSSQLPHHFLDFYTNIIFRIIILFFFIIIIIWYLCLTEAAWHERLGRRDMRRAPPALPAAAAATLAALSLLLRLAHAGNWLQCYSLFLSGDHETKPCTHVQQGKHGVHDAHFKTWHKFYVALALEDPWKVRAHFQKNRHFLTCAFCVSW